MKKKLTYKVFSIVLAVSVLFSSCASTTLIESYPSGAKVYIDGEQVGRTPYRHTDTKIMGSVTNIDLVKEGYEPLFTSIVRSERLDAGAIFCGFYLWAPFLWSMRYNPIHSYELMPLNQFTEPVQAEMTPQNPYYKSQKVVVPVLEQASPKLVKLRELKQLLDENLISKDDFEKQKQKILDEK